MFINVKHTMKKLVWVLILAVFVIAMLTSCNKNVCPAYVMDSKTHQVENKG